MIYFYSLLVLCCTILEAFQLFTYSQGGATVSPPRVELQTFGLLGKYVNHCIMESLLQDTPSTGKWEGTSKDQFHVQLSWFGTSWLTFICGLQRLCGTWGIYWTSLLTLWWISSFSTVIKSPLGKYKAKLFLLGTTATSIQQICMVIFSYVDRKQMLDEEDLLTQARTSLSELQRFHHVYMAASFLLQSFICLYVL